MWKMSFLAVVIATMFLGGCNWGNKAVEETPMHNVKNDVRRGVNDVVEPNNPNGVYDNRDVNGNVNNNNVPNMTNPNVTNPNSNADVNGSNGYDHLPNENGTNRVKEDVIIKEKTDVNNRDTMNNR